MPYRRDWQQPGSWLNLVVSLHSAHMAHDVQMRHKACHTQQTWSPLSGVTSAHSCSNLGFCLLPPPCPASSAFRDMAVHTCVLPVARVISQKITCARWQLLSGSCLACCNSAIALTCHGSQAGLSSFGWCNHLIYTCTHTLCYAEIPALCHTLAIHTT